MGLLGKKIPQPGDGSAAGQLNVAYYPKDDFRWF